MGKDKVIPPARRHLFIPPSASIPYGTINVEHEELVALVNRAYEVGEEAQFSSQLLGPLYEELKHKLAKHFASEERMMELSGFPGLAAHKVRHQKLLAKAFEICERARQGYFGEAGKIESFFDCIIDDMLRADLPFKTYLEQNGMC